MKGWMVVVAAVVLLPAFARGHGEDRRGPHGGAVRMPGAFHTEVLQPDERTVLVYLLDVSFREPEVSNSSVEVSHLLDGRRETLECRPSVDHFVCASPPRPPGLATGELEVSAARAGVTGAAVRYPLPVRPPGAR